MDNVIVIRTTLVPSVSSHLPLSKRCECIDSLSKHPNPDCVECGGSGIIEYPSEFKSQNEGSIQLLKADIVFENALTIYNDEDESEIPITDIMAYFNINDDVQIGDNVQHKGKKYRVVATQRVSSIKNDLYLLCCLERIME